MKHIVILGAGLAGMAIALELNRSPRYKDWIITIIEKQPHPGGLLYGTMMEGHHFDNGCYVFSPHTSITDYCPISYSPTTFNWKIWLEGKYTPYPPSYQSLTKDSSIIGKAHLIISMLYGRIMNYFHKPRNGQEWLEQNIGKVMIAATHLDGYLSKLQGIETNNIHTALCDSRLLHLKQPLIDLFKRQFLSRFQKPASATNSGYCYPGAGTTAIVNYLYERCESSGIQFIFSADLHKIQKDGDSFTLSLADTIIEANKLYSTIPLSELVKTLPQTPALGKFPKPEYTTLYVPMFLLKKLNLPGEHVILYSFDQKHKWKRIVGIKQPDETITVIVETNLTTQLDDNEQAALLLEVKQEIINELKLFQEEDILLSSIKMVPFAYPLYRKTTYDGIIALQQYIESYYSIHLYGRQGTHDYFSASSTLSQVLKGISKELSTD